MKNYLIDIDGTITDDIDNSETERMITAKPFLDARTTLNRWYNEGHYICFFTSRTEEMRTITEDWLQKHGFLYNQLLMNKPRGGNYRWIDNLDIKATKYHGLPQEWENMKT